MPEISFTALFELYLAAWYARHEVTDIDEPDSTDQNLGLDLL